MVCKTWLCRRAYNEVAELSSSQKRLLGYARSGMRGDAPTVEGVGGVAALVGLGKARLAGARDQLRVGAPPCTIARLTCILAVAGLTGEHGGEGQRGQLRGCDHGSQSGYARSDKHGRWRTVISFFVECDRVEAGTPISAAHRSASARVFVGRSGHQDRHGSSLLSTVNQIVVPRLMEDGRWKMASFVLRLPSSVQKRAIRCT
jgi:hypothetical protein